MKTKWRSIVNRDRFQLLVSAILSAALLLSLVFLGTQSVAWFKNFITFDEDAMVTNFVTKTEYRFGNNGEWTVLDAGAAIDVTPTNVNNLQLRVSYQGESAAYVRTMISGSFKNEDTLTILPQPEKFWSLSGNNWTTYGDYTYYTQLLQKSGEADDASTADVELKPLDVLKVSADLDALGSRSSYQGYTGELYVIVDAVQPDRYDEIWGVTAAATTTTVN